MPRLFTGLEIPTEAAFVLGLKRGGLPGARWIDPENYHITLRFIGDVDHATAHEIAGALDRFVDGPPFALSVQHFGVFGGNKPRSLYAGVGASAPLSQLHASQERLLQRLGLKPESRKFTPHITLARLRDSLAEDVARYLSAQGSLQPITLPVSRFVLFSSRDSVGGGPYVVEQAYPLAA